MIGKSQRETEVRLDSAELERDTSAPRADKAI